MRLGLRQPGLTEMRELVVCKLSKQPNRSLSRSVHGRKAMTAAAAAQSSAYALA
jgi:hypothetical protein